MKKKIVIKEAIISIIAFCGSFFISHWIVNNHPNWSIALMTLTLGIFLALLFFIAGEEALERIKKSKIWQIYTFLIKGIEKIRESVFAFFEALLALMPFIWFGISLMLENFKERRGFFWKKE